MSLLDWYNQELSKINQRQASDREVARLVGMTIEQFDADTTAPDEREECTECPWFSPEPGHYKGARCHAPSGCVE